MGTGPSVVEREPVRSRYPTTERTCAESSGPHTQDHSAGTLPSLPCPPSPAGWARWHCFPRGSESPTSPTGDEELNKTAFHLQRALSLEGKGTLRLETSDPCLPCPHSPSVTTSHCVSVLVISQFCPVFSHSGQATILSTRLRPESS